MIQKFDGEFPVSHLRFRISSDLDDNINAQTSSPENYVIEIKVNRNNLDRPELSIARTLIHETIHAEMWRKIESGASRGYVNRTDFPGIFDYYTRYKENFQHEQMAAHYIDTIISLLKEFDFSQSDDVYYALAWTGLKDTEAGKKLSEPERQRINQIVQIFNNSSAP